MLLDPTVDPAWASFVECCPGASIFHHPAWLRLLRDQYGYELTAICIPDGRAEVAAGLPVGKNPQHLTGKRLVALPFSDKCGPLIRAGAADHRDAKYHVHGALKCYSLECFQAIGGVSVKETLGWDTIDQTYARMRGFRTRTFPELVAIHHRPWASADGTLRGRGRYGEAAYIVQFTLPWVTLRSFKVARSRPKGLSGAAFLYGYLRTAAQRRQRVEDAEFRSFVRRELRERLRSAASPVTLGRLARRTVGATKPA